MIDASALHVVLAVLTGWLDRRERQAISRSMRVNKFFAPPAAEEGFTTVIHEQ